MGDPADATADDYRRNFLAGLVHGVFFQASAALSSIHTVLPSFVALLTPSTFAIGLMASIQGAGEVVPQLFTAYFIEDRPRKKPLLLWVITLRWVSWAVIAALTAMFGLTHPTVVLVVLILLFSVFSVAGGAGAVVYADVFSKAIPARRRGRFTGARQLIGYGTAVGAGWLVSIILDDEQGLAFPTGYAVIFGLTALSLLVAFTGFAMIREPEGPAERVSTSVGALIRRAWALARTNRNFRRMLSARAAADAVLALGPFYVVYALDVLDTEQAMVGTYLAVQMAGGASSNLLWGWMADRFGNRTVVVGTAITGLVTPLAAVFAGSEPLALLVTFAALGATMSGLRLGYANLILEMADVRLRPTCVALQNTLLAPVTLLPLAVAGLIALLGYRLMFGLGVSVMVVGGVIAMTLVDPRIDPDGACIEDSRP